METNIQENGRVIKKMEKELTLEQMVINMQVSGKMMQSKDKVFIQ